MTSPSAMLGGLDASDARCCLIQSAAILLAVSSPASGEAYSLFNHRKDADVPKILRDHGHFLEYVIMPLF